MRRIFYILSPTRIIIDFIKSHIIAKQKRADCISLWIYFWLLYSIALTVMIQFLTIYQIHICDYVYVTAVSIAISRINEIMYAYLSDALGRISQHDSEFDLFPPAQRVSFIGTSYVELAEHFALLAYATQQLADTDKIQTYNHKFTSIFDATYFSVMTITTTGYGDIYPTYSISKIISMYEPLTGVVLFALALGVYLSAKPK